jgi:chromosomal replication initiator protein
MEQIWSKVLEVLEGKVNQQVFENWFKPTRQISYQEGVLTVSVPNQFFKEWLNTEDYKSMIEASLEMVAEEAPVVRYETCSDTEDHPPAEDSPPPLPKETRDSAPDRLNSSYTFRNFVVGASNQFAHAASIAVSESPAKAYNPLFIYGGVGLGKTHLMHAIGHHVLGKPNGTKLLYVTSEGFVNDLIASLQRDRMESFRNKYRSIDVLLIDDIQFISGKDRTQEEFFHTFNTLYGTGKQIVISSDRFPKEIAGLEERLRSRFEWGLIADIQPPDLETKLAILRKKSESLNIALPSDVSYLIASKVKTNIRVLEGALLRLSALADLTGSSITLDMASSNLADVLRIDNRPPSIEKIQKTVAEHFKVSVADLKSRKRNRSVALPRQIAMYLIRQHTEASLPEIGRFFGGKDHTTVLHSCRKIKSILKDEQDPISRAIKVISNKLDL